MTASYRTDKIQTLSFTYDFAVDGGATGTLTCPLAIPDNAIVVDGWVDVLSAVTSGTSAATVALSTGQGAGDLIAAIAVSGAPFSTTGIKGTLATFPNLGADAAHDSALEGIALVAGTKIKMTANNKPTVAINVEAVTGGKFEVFIRYFIGQ